MHSAAIRETYFPLYCRRRKKEGQRFEKRRELLFPVSQKIFHSGGEKMSKNLYKSSTNKMIDGVCGGIAEYFNVDPTIIRLAWILFCAMGGSGIIAYIIAAIIIPRNPEF